MPTDDERRAQGAARARAYRARHRVEPQLLPLRPCEYCGAAFQPVRRSARFCRPACRAAAHRHPAAAGD
jgi:hypothetical protein